MLEVLDRGNAAFLALLDLSAAFDTINHDLLLDILNRDYHVTGTALKWFGSYLEGRTYQVKIGDTLSEKHGLLTGVPQGSILGPVLFNVFSSGLADIFNYFKVSSYYYADDTQFFVEFDPQSDESEQKARNLIQNIFSGLTE